MVALVVSLCGALALAAVTWVPPALGRDSGLRPVQPGLLVVAPEAAGVVTLGRGRAVQLDDSGLRVTHRGDRLLRTVRMGSPVSALLGRVEGRGEQRREEVTHTLADLEIDRLAIRPGEATWSGRLTGDDRELPITLTVRLEGLHVTLTAEATGADALVVHSHQELATRGLGSGLPERLLRQRAWWVGSGPGPVTEAYSTSLGTLVGVGPRGSARGVDLRRMGHTDLHVWSSSATVTVTSYRRMMEE